MKLRLSLVIPAYNEVKRLPGFLSSIREYLDRTYSCAYEVVIVDDGSEDGLHGMLNRSMESWSQLWSIHLEKNHGKGAAVRTGMLAAQGELILLCDGDGAFPIEQENNLRMALEQGADVAVGSRLVPGKQVRDKRLWYRSLFGRAFSLLVGHLMAIPVRDTQCGFKMVRRDVALRLVRLCRQRKYLFDVEFLAWAQRLGYRVSEVAVSCTDMPGSKVKVLRDGWGMITGLWKLRRSMREYDGTNAIGQLEGGIRVTG